MSEKTALKPCPTGSRLFVDRDTVSEKKTAGGIIIAEQQQPAPVTGVITAVGPDVQLFHAGDRVVFGRHAGHKFTVDDEEYLLLSEKDILAVFA